MKQLANVLTGRGNNNNHSAATAKATGSNNVISTWKNSRRSSVGTDSTQESSEKQKFYSLSLNAPSADANGPAAALMTRPIEQSPPTNAAASTSILRRNRRRASLGPTTSVTAANASKLSPGSSGVTGPTHKRRSSLSNVPPSHSLAAGDATNLAKSLPKKTAPNVSPVKPAVQRQRRRAQSLSSAAIASQMPKSMAKQDSAKKLSQRPRQKSLAAAATTAATSQETIASSSDQGMPRQKKTIPAVATPTGKKGTVKKVRPRAASFAAGGAQTVGNSNLGRPASEKTVATKATRQRSVPNQAITSNGGNHTPASNSQQVSQSPRRTGQRRLSATSAAAQSPHRSPSSQSHSSASRRLKQRVQLKTTHQEEQQWLHTPLESGPNTKNIFKSEQIDISPDLPMRQRSVESTVRQPMSDETEAAWDDYDDETDIVEESQTVQEPAVNPLSPVYQYARSCQWDMVVEECDMNPRDAKCVNETDGTTALHLAVMSRTNPAMRDGLIPGYDPAPLEVIEVLLMAAPEAAITRCTSKKYTPLHYACLVADKYYDMNDAATMIELIITRMHINPEEAPSASSSSTGVIKTLLRQAYSLAEARTYRNKMRSPIELLYRSNMGQFKEAVDDAFANDAVGASGATVTSKFSEWWALKWTVLILKYADSAGSDGDKRPFCALQAAASMTACPTPILALLCQMYPKQIEDRDPRDNLYNLPLHHVCSWRCDKDIICGDPFVIRRKLQAIDLLLGLYPEASRTTNNQGETPLQLAIESGTTWSGGLSILVKSCPKALKFPRKLRSVADINHNVLSVSLHNQALRTEREEEIFLHALDGMYPFMVAAVFARIPDKRRRDPAFLYDGQTIEDHRMQVQKKELDSLTAVYGLLRTKPDPLARYRETRASRRAGQKR
ncbi:hypothetical protein MPSEU_001004000 [Mayamaea pseudoterrestris]|nr:hypothetical protein MPSEU_001004000 [Mayamaea pseudoterrestris]